MKPLIYLLSVYCLIGCSNNKERIVEEIKKAKNERTLAEMNRGNYGSAAKHLLLYEHAPEQQKPIYKDALNTDKQLLKGVPANILDDQHKLDSIAFFWEMKASEAQRKIDSLELELKKY